MLEDVQDRGKHRSASSKAEQKAQLRRNSHTSSMLPPRHGQRMLSFFHVAMLSKLHGQRVWSFMQCRGDAVGLIGKDCVPIILPGLSVNEVVIHTYQAGFTMEKALEKPF